MFERLHPFMRATLTLFATGKNSRKPTWARSLPIERTSRFDTRHPLRTLRIALLIGYRPTAITGSNF